LRQRRADDAETPRLRLVAEEEVRSFLLTESREQRAERRCERGRDGELPFSHGCWQCPLSVKLRDDDKETALSWLMTSVLGLPSPGEVMLLATTLVGKGGSSRLFAESVDAAHSHPRPPPWVLPSVEQWEPWLKGR
jgi:hypothetical protein